MGNKSRKETRPDSTEFKSMDPHTIDESVNFNTATGKVIHLKKDLKPEAFENSFSCCILQSDFTSLIRLF